MMFHTTLIAKVKYLNPKECSEKLTQNHVKFAMRRGSPPDLLNCFPLQQAVDA